MTAGLDTSLVLRLLIGEPEAQAIVAESWLRRTVLPGGEPVQLSDLVVGESYLALRHHYGVPHAEAVYALQALAADPRIAVDTASGSVLRDPQSMTARPGFMDRLIHQQYQQDHRQMATYDRQAARLPGAIRLHEGKA